MTGSGKIIEIQGTAEESPFESEQFLQMMEYARNGIKHLIEKQKEALKIV